MMGTELLYFVAPFFGGVLFELSRVIKLRSGSVQLVLLLALIGIADYIVKSSKDGSLSEDIPLLLFFGAFLCASIWLDDIKHHVHRIISEQTLVILIVTSLFVATPHISTHPTLVSALYLLGVAVFLLLLSRKTIPMYGQTVLYLLFLIGMIIQTSSGYFELIGQIGHPTYLTPVLAFVTGTITFYCALYAASVIEILPRKGEGWTQSRYRIRDHALFLADRYSDEQHHSAALLGTSVLLALAYASAPWIGIPIPLIFSIAVIATTEYQSSRLSR